MRIIGGIMRGTKLYTLEGLSTRPTLDRVKESLFNILSPNLPNSTVLDLFSGSGALALESLSRGAKEAVLCDSSKQAINIINKNIEKTRSKDKIYVLNLDYEKALEKLQSKNMKFDIIFLDPPYESDYAEKAAEEIVTLNLLEDNGIIIIETDNTDKVQKNININLLKLYDVRKYGRVSIMFFCRKEK